MKSYKIGIKLLGLYFVFSGISIFPGMLIIAGSIPVESGMIYVISLLFPVLTILAGLFLYLKTEVIAQKSQSGFEQNNSIDEKLYFSSAIQLLGIYFFISHIGEAFEDIFMFFAYNPKYEKTMFDTRFYSNTFIAFLGLSLIFKGKALAKYINETTK